MAHVYDCAQDDAIRSLDDALTHFAKAEVVTDVRASSRVTKVQVFIGHVAVHPPSLFYAHKHTYTPPRCAGLSQEDASDWSGASCATGVTEAICVHCGWYCKDQQTH
jgi:hypothetical protein